MNLQLIQFIQMSNLSSSEVEDLLESIDNLPRKEQTKIWHLVRDNPLLVSKLFSLSKKKYKALEARNREDVKEVIKEEQTEIDNFFKKMKKTIERF